MCLRLVVVALIVLCTLCVVLYTGNESNVAQLTNDVNRSAVVVDLHRTVSMCPVSLDKRRLGNQLFNFATMVRVAKLTGRRVVMPQRASDDWINKWFDVDVILVDGNLTNKLCPCHYINEQRPLTYDASLASKLSRRQLSYDSILMCGWFQSWKYTKGIERLLRRQLTPRPDVADAVKEFFAASRPVRWTASQHHAVVGIHVRVADIMNNASFRFGYTVPRREFFVNAMRRAVDEVGRGRNTIFAVASDGVEWCKNTLNLTSLAADISDTSDVEISVVYSIDHDPGFDLIMLSMCDAVIMTTGTFGWWGAWLANKTTYYFSNWPRPKSWLYRSFTHSDFFPKNWIGVFGPYLEF